MRLPSRSLSSFLLFPCLAAALFAQDPAAAPAAPASKAASQPFHVRVIGASVSGGFRDGPMTGASETGETVTMQHLLKAWCGEHGKATTHSPLSMMAMFTAPERIGEEQVKAAARAKPDALLAIDFLFWFAYGYTKGDDATKARRELLQKGLGMLAKFEVPVVIGDLPDMQGASQRLLNPAQIPDPEQLMLLNADLTKFMAEHKNVRLVPLAATVAVMKDQGVLLPLQDGPLPTAPGTLLQGDRLHANRLGMAFLGHTLQPTLQQLFPEKHPLRTQTWTFEQFVVACGAEEDLKAARAAAAKAKDGAPAPAGSGK
jgi:hypothetical protein